MLLALRARSTSLSRWQTLYRELRVIAYGRAVVDVDGADYQHPHIVHPRKPLHSDNRYALDLCVCRDAKLLMHRTILGDGRTYERGFAASFVEQLVGKQVEADTMKLTEKQRQGQKNFKGLWVVEELMLESKFARLLIDCSSNN